MLHAAHPGVVCPGWGCIIAMLRQHGQPPGACWPGCAPCADCPGWLCAWAVVMGRPHIMALEAVEPVWADAWVIIGQARTGVAMKPVATERAIVSFLIVFPPSK